MAVRDDQIDKVKAAAQWLRARNAEVQQEGFTLQQVQVDIHPTEPGAARRSVRFTWQDDHYEWATV